MRKTCKTWNYFRIYLLHLKLSQLVIVIVSIFYGLGELGKQTVLCVWFHAK